MSSKLQEKARKPDWLKRELPAGDNYTRIKGKLRELKLSTVRSDAGDCVLDGAHSRLDANCRRQHIVSVTTQHIQAATVSWHIAAGVRGGAVPEHRGVLGRRGGSDRHRHHHAHGRHLHTVSGPPSSTAVHLY